MSRHTPWEIGFLPTPEYGLNGFTVMNRGRIGEKEAFRIIRLFTAAPELLAACEAVLALVEKNDDPEMSEESLEQMAQEAADRIRAAIAKAKGE